MKMMPDKKEEKKEFNDNNIALFLHCKLCISELPANLSPREYGSIEVGWTKEGIQVWCKRHECNVLHIDFEGQKHPADLTRKGNTNEEDVGH